MDTSGLQSKYAALRDYLISADLYGTGATENFDREELSRRFTEYYDAEAALRQELVDVKGAGMTIIENGFIRTNIIKTNVHPIFMESMARNYSMQIQDRPIVVLHTSKATRA